MLRSYVPQLINLVGEQHWQRRIDALTKEGQSSQALGRIISDYHWLECILDDEARRYKVEGPNVAAQPNKAALAQTLRALRFARNVAGFAAQLDGATHKVLKGRLRDALKSATGFLPLAQELEFASFGAASAFSTTLPDASGIGRQDACFEAIGSRWYVECKFLSADAGRKITRRDFYRLVSLVEQDLRCLRETHAGTQAVVVTLHGRLEAGAHLHGELPAAIRQFCLNSREAIHRSGFKIEFDHLQGVTAEYGSDLFNRELQRRFGSRAHAYGTVSDSGGCTILIARSEKPDDVSRPLLEAMTDAAKQLPVDGRGVISLHLQGISSEDLDKPRLQEHILLISNYLFLSRPRPHIASVHVAPSGELSVAQDLENYRALSFPNPTCPVDLERLVFPNFIGNDRVRMIRKPWESASSVRFTS